MSVSEAQNTLVRRLRRPAYRAGLSDRRVSAAILTRARTMVAGLPLADLALRHGGAEYASFGGDLPVVHAAPFLPATTSGPTSPATPARQALGPSRSDHPEPRSAPQADGPGRPVAARRTSEAPSRTQVRSGQVAVPRLRPTPDDRRSRLRQLPPRRLPDPVVGAELPSVVARPEIEPTLMTVVGPEGSDPTGTSAGAGRPVPGANPLVKAMPAARLAPADPRRPELRGRPPAFPELPVPHHGGMVVAGAVAAGAHPASAALAGRAVGSYPQPTPGLDQAGLVAAVVPGRSIGTASVGAVGQGGEEPVLADGLTGSSPAARSESPEVTERRLVASVQRQFLRRLSIEAERRAVR